MMWEKPWMCCQCIAMHTHSHMHSHLEIRFANLPACFGKWEESWSSKKTPKDTHVHADRTCQVLHKCWGLNWRSWSCEVAVLRAVPLLNVFFLYVCIFLNHWLCNVKCSILSLLLLNNIAHFTYEHVYLCWAVKHFYEKFFFSLSSTGTL